jgi:hypothetical protein
MRKGQRVRAICGDGVCRSVAVTASQPWAWDAISASAQVTIHGARFTLAGNLSGVGVTDSAIYRHAAPPGVAYRFHSNALTSLCGCTPHRPVAPALRRLAARLGLNRFGCFAPVALCWLAVDLRAVAASRGLVTPRPGGDGGAHERAEANRSALARVKPEPLARMARLAWAFLCFKGHAGKGAWDTARRI